MSQSVYLRPVGFVPASLITAGEGDAVLLPVAAGALAFTAVELIVRDGRSVSRRIVPLAELCERDWGRPTVAAAARLDALREPRRSLAGLRLDRPRIMGIVNVTPDSFSDGGRHLTAAAAIDHGLRLAEEGADILDVGGESTRPGSDPVPLDEELRRVLPVIEGLRGRVGVPISVDTRKAEVMRRAHAAGADILNDVSALTFDPDALDAAAECRLPVVLMHALGDPKTMQENPVYDDVLLDVFDYLERRIEACIAAGIPRSQLIVDPGIGFGKTLAHNVALMAGIAIFHGLGVPVLLGASRKRFIGALTGDHVAGERVEGSVAAALAAAAQGCQIIRVHDVAATRKALAVWRACVLGEAVDDER